MMDHPTRRLDSSDEDAAPEHATQRLAPLAPDLSIRPCLRCQNPMINARVRPHYPFRMNDYATLKLERPLPQESVWYSKPPKTTS